VPSRIERALLDLENVVRIVLNGLGDRVAVCRAMQ
jgi:hypothetical protein